MLTPEHCDLFKLPFFQFAQLKKYQPQAIPQIKADYRAAWQTWRALMMQVSGCLGAPFAPPHIERWCNGWQVRAHFFAFFKYAQYQEGAAILSVLLNRRRLTVSLDWHSHKAAGSNIALAQYNRWPQALDQQTFAGFDMWHGSDSEYADYPTVAQRAHSDGLKLQSADDFFCIGRHLERDELAHTDCAVWVVQTLQSLQPVYESVYR
ncbi:glucose-6-phosphate 1-dehydrogenase family protein [Uruburuella testudinis]|uniref:Glucose-6-phosphate 1-dehydrogenase family protein n=1 Tax=Uruburuella testudinis TaxID=1282863 RepID=A0ABY4DWL6_9NEIS|nr:glucose-6-phosphate 1-dehydrogenase family protein [Uruburuella testudinis]UOO83183.1 glucose-6-phosphate 1-dehydrogenase family protein [Uruburuella testudinis]